MIKLIVTVVGLILIAFIAWWFFAKHEKDGQKAVRNGNIQEITVEVNGGYKPETLILEKDVPARITFDRKDPSTCLDQVVLPEFGAHLDLPLHEKTVVTVQPNESGEFGFACGMNMFHGKIIVD
ncbi:cupredoxin domain-containing protein [Streptococcus mutans]|uniref:cupredoxin domain-containing protein n=1 Tax=Streptococcus mutans TaxID=1309 RepID=UPI0002B5888A|nr:cupredoxin domain-containing protein [Streptococcus mutans]EMC36051.1 hypothetical protein SMU93_06833 [Streptococcus mutans 21]EMC46548.1 hypothetical protein SMU99_02959 [Streptococcus mutans 24]MCY7128060.1 cupredoxin domain-containing protein [Streptococcus mutans]MDT9562212.1 cupredoxin domain-containing protein [Streptococcus mutans]MDT9565906.1 cupredoxin domain-containing protein [Streptococcus mutans]